MGRLNTKKPDRYYSLAKSQGYRARSAFKLLQLDAEFHLFRNVQHCVDLCAAPGSWSQVLSDQLYDNQDSKIVAVDLQPMADIRGVDILQGDITEIATSQAIIRALHGQQACLVVCDGAPDVTGLHDLDEYLQQQLLLSAMLLSTHVLKPQGTFVAKMFKGSMTDFLYGQLRILFERVSIAKPPSSRSTSMEAFVVCEKFNDCHRNLPLDTSDVRYRTGYELPFLRCGDLSGWKPPEKSKSSSQTEEGGNDGKVQQIASKEAAAKDDTELGLE